MSQGVVDLIDGDARPAKVTIGPALSGFLNHVAPEAARESLQADAVAVLERCALAGDHERITGIVVGQVQSGKTMSYEALIALAHDSGFPLVVVISGVSNPLLDQGTKRLRGDLSRASARTWAFLRNPSLADSTSREILKKLLDDWDDDDVPIGLHRTAVITVLKHHGHLSKLAKLVKSLPLNGKPILAIDDEADQASLNAAVRRNRESSTYRVLKELRQELPTFSYIQYTATPQAPLLISIADALSPSFVHVLEPGEGYVGGESFFTPPATNVRTISADDMQRIENGERPRSLTDALRVFALGLAYEIHSGPAHDLCRSMLVHPSQAVDPRATFSDWVKRSRDEWIAILQDEENNPEDYEALLDDFEISRGDLQATSNTQLPPVREVVKSLKYALRQTLVITMNAADGPTPSIPWEDSLGFVLVGGQALDRGFTVNGLTVTYMPRGLGVGNADSIQQRARFFGYKADYLGLCRVYLEPDLRTAFERYVDHEADVRARLKDVEEKGTPLREWRRAFILDTMLSPTRRTVLDSRALGDQVADDWRYDDSPAIDNLSVTSRREIVAAFASGVDFLDDPGHEGRSPSQRHRFATDVPLAHAIELLSAIPVTDSDPSLEITGMVLQLEAALQEDNAEVCDVYLMRPRIQSSRGIDPLTGRIRQLFQGGNPPTRAHARGEIYPGDRNVHASSRVTLQVHTLDLTAESVVVASGVPVVATWVPARLAKGWYVQER